MIEGSDADVLEVMPFGTRISGSRTTRRSLRSSCADHLDLDRGVEWQPSDPDRGAGGPTVLTGDPDEQLTGRVGDLRLQAPVRLAGHEDQHLYDPDPLQVADCLDSGGEAVERGVARELLPGLQIDVSADDTLAQQHA